MPAGDNPTDAPGAEQPPPHPIPVYPIGTPIPLPEQGTWPKSIHRFDADTAAALRAAEAAERPLLIRGDPGTGESQTARAAAAAAGRLFVSVTIDGRTEAADLLWQHDAVARLADAQSGQGAGPPGDYLSPGPLWWAYDWTSAERQWQAQKQGERPDAPAGWRQEAGTVLLIDEIDKADPDLPNAFLELLGNRGFTVPLLGRQVIRGARPPLVIITTNEERELPNAFLRRCLVRTLRLPEPLAPWLAGMGRLHLERLGLAACCFDDVLAAAARLLLDDRRAAEQSQRYQPGLAEYLDLVIAVARLEPTEPKQQALLGQLAGFALRKSDDAD
jgi:MoxR-like ATPase